MPYANPDEQRKYWRNYRRRKYIPVKTRKPTGRPSKDITGQRFGRLVAQWPSGIAGLAITWLCLCDCGNFKIARGINLRFRHTVSCGCLNRENRDAYNLKIGRTVHHKSGTPEFKLWWAAKCRSRVRGIPFNISVEDIIIPSHCPLLGIPLHFGKGRPCNNSPSLDRLEPECGYTKNNIWVISWRANTLKSDSTLQEMQLIVKNWSEIHAKVRA